MFSNIRSPVNLSSEINSEEVFVQMDDFKSQQYDIFRINVLRKLSDLLIEEITETAQKTDLKLGNGFSLSDYLEQCEKNIILHALDMTNNNQLHAARLLGIKHSTLNWKIKRYSLGSFKKAEAREG